MEKPVGILFEHPLWFVPLFAELERREIAYEAVDASTHTYDPSEAESPYSLLVNRMSPSAWTRGHARAIFHTREYLAYLDTIGAAALNGMSSSFRRRGRRRWRPESASAIPARA